MALPRFFAQSDNADAYRLGSPIHVLVEDETLHHIAKVARIRVGESIEITLRDRWCTYQCEVVELASHRLIARVQKSVEHASDPWTFALFWGCAKADTNEHIVRHAVEIGCDELSLVQFQRCDPSATRGRRDQRHDRLCSIAESATLQSHRSRIPPVNAPMAFGEMLERIRTYDAVLVAWEEQPEGSVSRAIDTILADTDMQSELRIALVVGPEGGITQREIDALKEHGAVIISMGPTILRVETACVAICSITADRLRTHRLHTS